MSLEKYTWESYYNERSNILVPESFVVRAYVSRSPVSFLKDYNFNTKQILDLGCGAGRHSLFLDTLGFKVVGCEVSPSHVEALNKKFPRLKFVVGVAPALPFSNATFDFVLAVNSIYYLGSPSESLNTHLSEVSRVLRPGGCFVGSFVSEGHFILDSCTINEDRSATFVADPLGIRNSQRIRPLWNDEDLHSHTEHTGFTIHKSAALSDCCDGKCRVLRYYSLYKE
jgi:SAM-dependent methyltransferase